MGWGAGFEGGSILHPHTVERIARAGEETGHLISTSIRIATGLYPECGISLDRCGDRHGEDGEQLRLRRTIQLCWKPGGPLGKGPVGSLCIGEPRQDMQRFYEWLVEHTAGGGRYLPFHLHLFGKSLPHGVDKASGVAFLAQELRRSPREEIVAVGDGATDACTPEYAGLGIAMGNASQAAKDAADMVALTNEEDGAAARALVQAFRP